MKLSKKLFFVILFIFIFFVFIKTALAASVSVSSTAVVQGGTVRATWSGFSGNVNIAVYKGTSFWTYADTDRLSSGYQDLVTTGWELRSDYRVKIELRSSPSTYQYSDYFSVSSPSVSVSPTSVVQGGTVRATWAGFSGNVNIAVYKGGSFWTYANTDRPGSSYQDLDTTGWEIRSDYRAKVELRANTSVYKYSNYFSVTVNIRVSYLEANFSVRI